MLGKQLTMIIFLRLSQQNFVTQHQRTCGPLVEIPACGLIELKFKIYD